MRDEADRAEDRFWAKARIPPDVITGCWEWMGGKSGLGYGEFSLGGRRRAGAHRFAYEALRGPIPAGLFIDHLCSNPSCVNPHHLEAVTNAENVRRGTSPLTAHLAAEIRSLPHVGSRDVGERYGVSPELIRSIWAGYRWAVLP